MNMTQTVVLVSGGFDPIHIGHVAYFQEAKKLGTKLFVLVNNDNWLKLKKGFAFMPEQERCQIIQAFACVDEVQLTTHAPNTQDISVCKDLERIKPDIFAKGGDRTPDNIPEYALCEKLGITMVFNVGIPKTRSSSEFVQKAAEASRK